jgi:hypothetical protein
MDILLGVGAGVLSIVLGVIGIVVSLHPPSGVAARRGVTALFSVLSLIAIGLTIADKRLSDRKERSAEEQIAHLRSASDTLVSQNRELLGSNATLQQQVAALSARPGPYEVALDQTLKHEIVAHLAAIRDFLAERTRVFNIQNINTPPDVYPARYTAHRQLLASEYSRKFLPTTCRLLGRAAQRHLIPSGDCEMDGRYIEAGLIPYMDDLQKIAARLPD